MIAAIALSISANCQSPLLMSYQSVIRNSSGDLINNGNVGFRISILQGSVTGSAVYAETHSVTTNSNGLATLNIGGGTPSLGSILGINWESGPYFIKTETDPTGGTNYTLSGTSQLLSVPYALYAAKSGDNYWKPHANGIQYTAGRIGVGKAPHSNVPISVLQENSGIGQAVFEGLSNDTWQACISFQNNPINSRYSFVIAGPSCTVLTPGNFGIWNHNKSNWFLITDKMTNNIGIGSPSLNTTRPKASLDVYSGDIAIEEIGKGIIMKSSNGQCWRVTIDNNGNFVNSPITCP